MSDQEPNLGEWWADSDDDGEPAHSVMEWHQYSHYPKLYTAYCGAKFYPARMASDGQALCNGCMRRRCRDHLPEYCRDPLCFWCGWMRDHGLLA